MIDRLISCWRRRLPPHDDGARGRPNHEVNPADMFDAYFWPDDVDALHKELADRGATIIQAPTDQPYGLREFRVQAEQLPDEVRDRPAGLLYEEALEEAVQGLGPEELTDPGWLLTQLAGRGDRGVAGR
jgi:hypothetical protein